MKDEIEFTLKSPLTEEQINLITDAEFEHTDRIWFYTPKGKHIEFVKAQQWIPCSERLPENGHYYLWCSDMGSVQSDYYWDGFEKGMKYGYNIVAWMPLPKPYKTESEDEK